MIDGQTLGKVNRKIEIRKLIKNEGRSFSLFGGKLSNALLWGQIGINENCHKSIDQALSIIRDHMSFAQKRTLTFKYSIGITGLAWVIQLFGNSKIISKKDCETLNKIDQYVGKSLKFSEVDIVYDLFQGIIGKGLYFIERKNKYSISKLEEIVDFFEHSAVKISSDVIAWPDYYTSYHDKTERDGLGYYNFGLAHGIPSIIVFLSKLFIMGIAKEKCRSLIKKSINFLLIHKKEQEPIFSYPTKVYPKNGHLISDTSYKKLGWCYGPLSMSIAYLAAYKVLNEKSLFNEAFRIAKETSRLDAEEIVKASNEPADMDIYFCHGTSGLAYIYYLLHSVFKDESTQYAMNYWKEKTYDKVNEMLQKKQAINPSGVIDGITGVCMVMNELELNVAARLQWNKMFLLDQI